MFKATVPTANPNIVLISVNHHLPTSQKEMLNGLAASFLLQLGHQPSISSLSLYKGIISKQSYNI